MSLHEIDLLKNNSSIMRHILITILFIFTATLLVGQISITASYVNSNDEGYSNDFGANYPAVDPNDYLSSGIEASIGWWMRFTKVRMEFIPAISITRLQSDFYSGWVIGGQINTLIYPLDFYSDCGTCPTFSKDGGLLKKGFHWIISPGFAVVSGEVKDDSFNLLTAPDNSSPYVDLGAGLDFGVSNMVTITPYAVYRVGFTAQEIDPDINQNLRQLQLGARATFRFDRDRW